MKIPQTLLLLLTITAGLASDPVDEVHSCSPFRPPLAWVGKNKPGLRECNDLCDVLKHVSDQSESKTIQSLEDFLGTHPESPWNPALKAHLAEMYNARGAYSRALNHWKESWDWLKDYTEGDQKRLADQVLAHYTRLLSSLGRVDVLESIYAETEGRTLTPFRLNQYFHQTREALPFLKGDPGRSYRCGTFALYHVGKAMFETEKFPYATLRDTPSPKDGFSVDDLSSLADKYELGLKAVIRIKGDEVVVPSVLHWRENHFAAIIGERGSGYVVIDPTFTPARKLITREVLREECDGVFLIPVSATLPPGYRELTKKERMAFRGKGFPNFIDDDYNIADPPNKCGQPQDTRAIPALWVQEPYVTEWVQFTPVHYESATAGTIDMKMFYKQRQTFLNTLLPNFGDHWEASLYKYIEDNNEIGYAAVRERGSANWIPYNTGEREYRRLYKLTRYPTTGVLDHFVLENDDGSTETYGKVFVYFDSGFHTNALLTTKELRTGRTYTYNWTNVSSGFQLTSITDPDNHNITFSYDATEYFKITAVQDPFGVTASMVYDGTSAMLSQIIAPCSITNYFTYSLGTVTAITTPYGTTSISVVAGDSAGNVHLPSSPYDVPNRAIRIDYPDQTSELYMYKDSSQYLGDGVTPHIPNAYSGTQVPTNTVMGTLDNNIMYYRNSFFWDRKHYAQLSTATLTNFTLADYRLSRLSHWLHRANDGGVLQLSETLSMQWDPPLDGQTDGQMTWYDYEGRQLLSAGPPPVYDPVREGKWKLPGVILRVVPEGSTNTYQYTWYQRDSDGYPTNIISTYTKADGTTGTRTNSYLYSNFDMVRATNALSQLTETNLYNVDHKILVHANGLNETTTTVYNTNNQVISLTLPTGLVTTNIYNASFRKTNSLQYVVVGGTPVYYTTNRWTYTNDLVYTHTDERGLTTTNTYDALRRITSTLYPDGTYISNIYYLPAGSTNTTTNIVELTGTRDRLGNWTYYGINSMRQKVAETNALNFRQLWSYSPCECDVPTKLTNAVSEVVTYNYDWNNNRTNTVMPGGINLSNRFDRLNRPEVQKTSLGSVTNIYNNQGMIVNAQSAFGSMLQTNYNILDQVYWSKDGDGVTVTNSYDIQGRTLTRTYPDGGAEAIYYMTNSANPYRYTNQLGTTTFYGYDPFDRRIKETNGNGHITQWTYDGQGKLTQLTDQKNHNTSWRYDVEGRLTNKLDHLGTNVYKYAYDAKGQMTNRIDAKEVQTRYLYSAAGNLTNVIYPTATNVFAYDGANRMASTTDWSGTSTFQYYGDLVKQEDGPWADDAVIYSYNSAGLRSQMNINAPNGTWIQPYTYDGQSRLSTITSQAGTFTYGYNNAGNRIKQLTLASAAVITNEYDSVGRTKGIWLRKLDGTLINTNTYQYNLAGWRTNEYRNDGSFQAYTYDPIGQLLSANAKHGTTNRLNEQFTYTYDQAGNLSNRVENGFKTIFAVDALNQLSTLSRDTTNFTVAGAASALPSTITVNSATPTLYADNTFARTNVTLSNGNNTFTASATDSNGRNASDSKTLNMPLLVSAAYDANGNLIYDGKCGYFYDEENQLISIVCTNNWKSEFTYDSKFRRRVRKEYSWVSSAWQLLTEVRYIVDGMLQIQERDLNNLPSISYTRGRDLRGDLSTGGGVAGMLARSDNRIHSQQTSYFVPDANGNIVILLTATSIPSARYLYDAFGNLLLKNGPMADQNLYRFSSKETHLPSGQIYFGYRYFQSQLQRWLNRDPKREAGGLNLFQFCRNNPLTAFDNDGEDVYLTVTPVTVRTGCPADHVDVWVENSDDNPNHVLKAWGAYGKAYYKWEDQESMHKDSQFADSTRIITTPEQDKKMIDFILKGEDHLAYIYCVNRAAEILTAGGIFGLNGRPVGGTGSTTTGLLQQIRVANDAALNGVADIMLDYDNDGPWLGFP
jgi:RHS repeat-associated protein